MCAESPQVESWEASPGWTEARKKNAEHQGFQRHLASGPCPADRRSFGHRFGKSGHQKILELGDMVSTEWTCSYVVRVLAAFSRVTLRNFNADLFVRWSSTVPRAGNDVCYWFSASKSASPYAEKMSTSCNRAAEKSTTISWSCWSWLTPVK